MVSPLSGDDLLRPTRCRGWVVADLLFHVLCDAQRALVTFATPAPGPSDVDYVSYWQTFPSGRPLRPATRGGYAARRSAFPDAGQHRARSWDETRAGRRTGRVAADPRRVRRNPGPRAVGGATSWRRWSPRRSIHHLDLSLDLPAAPAPDPDAVTVAVSTMDGLMSDDVVRPTAWSDADYLLKASGRLPLDPRDRVELGEAAGWFPLLS